MMRTKKHYPMKSDVREKKDRYILEMDLPGYKKEDIKARVENGYLVVSATKQTESNDENSHYIRRERYTGEISRSFAIDSSIKQDDIKASYKHGVLKFELPKVEQKERPQIQIQ